MAEFGEKLVDFLGDFEDEVLKIARGWVEFFEAAGLGIAAVEIMAEGAEELAVFVLFARRFGDTESAGFVAEEEAAVTDGGLFEHLAFALAPIGGKTVRREDGDEDA